MYPQKKNTGAIIAVSIGVFLLAVLNVALIMLLTADTRHLKKQLNLGQQYLSELNYEAAIASYKEALEIDGENAEALEGLKQSYVDYISVLENSDFDKAVSVAKEAYAYLGDQRFFTMTEDLYLNRAKDLADAKDYDGAIAILEKGLQTVDSKRLRDQIENYREEKREYEHELEQEALLDEVDEAITEIARRCSENDWDGVFDYMNSYEYETFLDIVPQLDEHRALDTGYGLLGIYRIDSEVFGDYMLYYGDYDGSERSGYGFWFGYYEGNNYLAEGDWANDAPNGYQNVREWSTILADSVVYRVLNGPVKDGLWDGEMTWGFEEADGYLSWGVRFHEGILEVQSSDGQMSFANYNDDYGGNLYVAEGSDIDGLWGIVGYAPY